MVLFLVVFFRKISIFCKERHFVTPSWAQAAYGPKNLDKLLKFCEQPPILAVQPDHKEIWGRRLLASIKGFAKKKS